MKKQVITLFIGLLITNLLYAQYSNLGFSFQGYAIDGEGKALASKGVTVRFTVYRTGISYVEEHALTTDAYGVFVANVGKGSTTSTPTFPELDFNNFDFSLKVEVRETTGGTFAIISDKALQAVPYARSASNGVPVGTIVAFAGPSTNIPTGWLLCDGGNGVALNATANPQYAQLFAAIGTTWGGTGASSFFVPDLRGLFLRGVNGTRADSYADAVPSRVVGSLQWYQTARPNTAFTVWTNSAGNHSHTYENPADYSDAGRNSVGWTSRDTNKLAEFRATGNTGGAGSHNHSIDSGTWAGGDPESSPKNAAVHYIIKY